MNVQGTLDMATLCIRTLAALGVLKYHSMSFALDILLYCIVLLWQNTATATLKAKHDNLQ